MQMEQKQELLEMDQKNKPAETEVVLNYRGQNTLGYDINELLKAKFTLDAMTDLENTRPKKQRRQRIKKQTKIEALQPCLIKLLIVVVLILVSALTYLIIDENK
jgi:hypothetical protein